MTTRAQYIDPKAAALENFIDGAHASARAADGTTLDSAAVKAVSKEMVSGADLPPEVQAVIARMPEDCQGKVLDAVLFGAESYRAQHGTLPTGDIIQAALHQGLAAANNIDPKGNVVALDSVGSTGHHDQISAQPNRIVVAITAGIAEAIPFATMLPTDIGSNEARLGIISHQAGATFGGYAAGDLLDGVNIGKPYANAERNVTLTVAGDRLSATGKITGIIGGSENTSLLRGRTNILINGYPCAGESPNTSSSAANSPISGSIRIAGTDYAIGGTVTVATGAVALTFTPALPGSAVVSAEGFIDYEAAPALAPTVLTQVQTFSLYAVPWRVTAHQTVDSRTQYVNELGLNLQDENLIAIRNQVAMERHYLALNKLMNLAVNNSRTYDFDWAGQKVEKSRNQIWSDAMSVIGVADQTMAEDTMDHGITHMYVSKKLAAQFQSLPLELWTPSGITVRPGIFRLGRFAGRYDVYYSPKVVTEGSGTAQILCIGRSTQVARCPVVLGDAVAPTYLPLAMNSDLRYSNAFYARNFTSVNPHQPSAMGAALINVTNLGL